MTDGLPVPRPSGEPAARRYLAERTRDLLREEAPSAEPTELTEPAEPAVHRPAAPAPHPRFLVSADLGGLDRGQVLSMVCEFLPGAVVTAEHACDHEGFRYAVHRNPDTNVVPYAWNILVIPLTFEVAAAEFGRARALHAWFEERGIAASPAAVREG